MACEVGGVGGLGSGSAGLGYAFLPLSSAWLGSARVSSARLGLARLVSARHFQFLAPRQPPLKTICTLLRHVRFHALPSKLNAMSTGVVN